MISELPLVLYFFRHNVVWVPSDIFCTLWCYIDYVLNVVILMLICYASIQRYLFVFHHNLVSKHLFWLHYFPLSFCVIYPSLFYFVFIFFYPCPHIYDFTMITCQGPCYLFERIPGSIDLIINLTVPLFLCVFTNLVLVSRVLHQKHRMKQQNKWKKNRSLLLQLLCIVIVHNVIWLPTIIANLINLFSPVPQQFFIDLSINLFTYSIYIVIMICPFISLFSLVDVRQQLFPNFCFFNRPANSIQPSQPPPQHPLVQMTGQRLILSSKFDRQRS